MKKNFILLFVISLASFHLAQAQTLLDNELWTDISASRKLSKKADMAFELGYRRDNDFSSTKIIYFNPDVEFEILKNLDLSLGYRYSVKPGNAGEHRWSIAASYGFKIKPFSFSYRLKFQQDLSPGNIDNALRNKLKIRYNMSKKIDPYVAFELFNDLNQFKQTRIALGVDLNLKKGREMTFYYMYRKKYNNTTPGTINVFGIGYDLGNLKKKKKKDND